MVLTAELVALVEGSASYALPPSFEELPVVFGQLNQGLYIGLAIADTDDPPLSAPTVEGEHVTYLYQLTQVWRDYVHNVYPSIWA